VLVAHSELVLLALPRALQLPSFTDATLHRAELLQPSKEFVPLRLAGALGILLPQRRSAIEILVQRHGSSNPIRRSTSRTMVKAIGRSRSSQVRARARPVPSVGG
jgi:hypothetical protein